MNVAQQRWALAAASTVIAAALAGGAWWFLAGRHEPAAVAPGAGFAKAGALGFMLEANTEWRHVTRDFDVQVVTNSLGLRGPEVLVPKPPDRYRVLVLGDSFTFGWGVALQDAWHARMARELQAPDGRTLDVVDAGVPGWTPLQQFVFLEQRGLDLQPDLVIWELCTNDPLEMERIEVEIDARRLPVAVAADPPLSAGLLKQEWVVEIEKLDPAVRERVEAEARAGRIDPVVREIARKAEAARRAEAGVAPEGPIAELPIEAVLRGLRSGPDFGVRYIDHMVSAARALCGERRVELRLMLAQARSKPRGASEPDDGVEALRAWIARQDPGALDTADVLTADRVEEFYFAKDPHWTPAAQPQVAQAVARWLAQDPALGLTLAPAR